MILPTPDSTKAIEVVDGKFEYPSAAESGHVEIELPSLPGSPNAVERLHARDFGVHVVGKIETSIKRPGYLKSGPQQTPAQVFRHYAAVAKGAGLMDAAASQRMESLAKEFEQTEFPAEYFGQVIRPYLHSLRPGKRQP